MVGGVVSGTLYVVATPLGNLEDLSARARRVLLEVDLVAAEDTRRTRTLLAHVGATPSVMSYHAHSRPQQARRILGTLAGGQDVALVTDAGTPGISDPGVDLVAQARAAGATVVPVPGPSAVPVALSAAGLPADRFTFLGFLPRKGSARRALLQAAAESPWTVVFFESAPRLAALLKDLVLAAGDERPVVVARELTKLHEELKWGTLHDLAVYYAEHEARGEVTVVLSGTGVISTSRPVPVDDVRERARTLLANGCSRRDVAAHVAEEFNLRRNDAYRLVTDL